MAECLFGQGGIRIRVLAEGPVVVLALPALAAGNRERHDHTGADLEGLDRTPDFHHLAHELVAEDVALLHGLYEAVIKVQVRAADRGRGDADDGVVLIQDLGIRDVPDLDALLAHPARRLHRRTSVPGACAERCLSGPCPAPSRLPSESTTSPVSRTCLNRRRSSRICWVRSSPESGAVSAPALPPGASYCRATSTSVPRSAGAGLKCTEPSCWISLPGRARQTINSPGRSSTISASHPTC